LLTGGIIGISQLSIAAVVFLAGHFGISNTLLRPMLIQRLGEKAYLGLYSVAALVAFVWLIMAWSDASYQHLWDATKFWSHLPYGGILIACFLLVGGLTVANPSMVGKSLDEGFDEDWRPRGILAVTRHPVMWAIGVWALAHLGANGDMAALIFFGSFALLALSGTVLIDRRKSAQDSSRWAGIVAATSNLPFLAMIQGRARLRLGELVVPVVGGSALWTVLMAAHATIPGVEIPLPDL
jgi:uncharacterized membrane protein